MNVLNKGNLGRRILKRLLSLIIVVWGVVTLSFCLQVFTGTDPAEMIVRKNSLFATEEQIQTVRNSLVWMLRFTRDILTTSKELQLEI